MNHVHQSGDVIGRGVGKDSVTKVKDVTRPIPCSVKDLLDILLD